MHHLFVTPLIAGVVTAGIIVLSPNFDDPYDVAQASEEPLVEDIKADMFAVIKAPAELQLPQMAWQDTAFSRGTAPKRMAHLTLPVADVVSDMPYQRAEFVMAKAPIAEGLAIPLSADLPRMEVAANRLNMRAGPGTTFKKLTTLTRGMLLDQTGKSDGPWLEIAVVDSGETGWLHSDYLREAQ